MKCLTICQPYAHLIVTPQAELPPGYDQKFVENRTWHSNYAGPLLIHAGKSNKFMSGLGVCRDFDGVPFGAIVGLVDMLGCVQIDQFAIGPKRCNRLDLEKWPWLMEHVHAEGPFGFIFENVRRFKQSIPYSGKQGLFEVGMDVVEGEIRRAPVTGISV